jgi:hypothetical protein
MTVWSTEGSAEWTNVAVMVVNERKENVRSTYDKKSGLYLYRLAAPSNVCDCLHRRDERHEVNECGDNGHCRSAVEAKFLHCRSRARVERNLTR